MPCCLVNSFVKAHASECVFLSDAEGKKATEGNQASVFGRLLGTTAHG